MGLISWICNKFQHKEEPAPVVMEEWVTHEERPQYDFDIQEIKELGYLTYQVYLTDGTNYWVGQTELEHQLMHEQAKINAKFIHTFDSSFVPGMATTRVFSNLHEDDIRSALCAIISNKRKTHSENYYYNSGSPYSIYKPMDGFFVTGGINPSQFEQYYSVSEYQSYPERSNVKFSCKFCGCTQLYFNIRGTKECAGCGNNDI